MEEKTFPIKSSNWDSCYNMVTNNSDHKIECLPFQMSFPENFSHGQEYKIILLDSVIFNDVIIDDFMGEPHWWLKGVRIPKEQVVAWYLISEPIPEGARAFFEKLEKEAEDTMELVRTLSRKMRQAVNVFESNNETLLFRDDTLCTDVNRGYIYRDAYYICGIKIFVVPWCNYLYSAKVKCAVKFKIVFSAKSKPTDKKPYFGTEPVFYWVGENVMDVFNYAASFMGLHNIGVEHYGDERYKFDFSYHYGFEELRKPLIRFNELLGVPVK